MGVLDRRLGRTPYLAGRRIHDRRHRDLALGEERANYGRTMENYLMSCADQSDLRASRGEARPEGA